MNPRSHRFSAAAITTLALAAAAAGTVLLPTAAGAPPAPPPAPHLIPPQVPRWTRISGPVGAGQQLGLARTKDGLSVIWNSNSGAGTPAKIFQTRISGAGAALCCTTAVADWDGVGGLAAQGSPLSDYDLWVQAAGGYAPGLPPGQVGIYTLQNYACCSQGDTRTFEVPDLGGGWWLAGPPGDLMATQPELFGGPAAAAAPFLSWNGGFTAWAAAGVADLSDGGSSPRQVCACAALSADVDLDANGGLGGVVGETIGDPAGTYVQQYAGGTEPVGPLTVLPSATQTMGDYGSTGAGGSLYVAWSDANRPGVRAAAVRLTRFDSPGSAPRTGLIAHGSFTVAKVFNALHDKHVWLVWGNAHAVFVTRSNTTATRFEPVQKLTPPAGTSFLWNAEGDASSGPLDVFVDAATGDGRGYWYTQVLAQLSLEVGLSSPATRPRVITLELRDAGDPLPSSTITLTLPNHQNVTLNTNNRGRAQFATRLSGKYTATASLPGYLPATTTFTLH